MTDNANKKVSEALPIGYRFNEFEIQEVLGSGGFGIVYRAWDHQLERAVAIKEFMPASFAMRKADLSIGLRGERFGKAFSAGLTSFIDEARLLARFNHPGLAQVLRFWVQNDTAYIVSLFYEGVTLGRLREQHPQKLDEAAIRRLLPMLFGALRVLHKAGYQHLDISPDNILLQENGLPVLLDPGAARRSIGNVTDETETLLRPGYAPVEQYNDDENALGPWTDIYALGAVLHTLIVGSPPPVSVVRSLQDNYQPLAERKPEGYSLSLLQAIDRALALKKEGRPQSVDEFAALVDLPVGGHDDLLNADKPGTMLIPLEEHKVAVTGWRRYQTAGMVAAGVVAGIIIGGLLFSGGAPQSAQPETADVDRPQEQPATAQPPAATGEQQALVYVRIREGEQLLLNGKPQAVVPAANGFAALQLSPGQYAFTLKNHDQIRSQRLTIGQSGTWLINPQS